MAIRWAKVQPSTRRGEVGPPRDPPCPPAGTGSSCAPKAKLHSSHPAGGPHLVINHSLDCFPNRETWSSSPECELSFVAAFGSFSILREKQKFGCGHGGVL
jgi:hypothetical protein